MTHHRAEGAGPIRRAPAHPASSPVVRPAPARSGSPLAFAVVVLADVAPAGPVLGAGHVAVLLAVLIAAALVTWFVVWVWRARPPADAGEDADGRAGGTAEPPIT